MKKLIIALSFVAVGAILFSCSKDESPDPVATPGPKFLAAKAVVTSSCALSGCHASPTNAGGMNLTTNEAIVANGSRIKTAAVDQSTMPPTGALNATSKTAISDWISAGGKLTD